MTTAMRLPLLALLLATTTACTWVHMAPGAQAVRVLGADAAPAGCTVRGDVTVSVKASIAIYERNALRVREELETLARNEAPGLGANAVQPLAEPRDGDQVFRAYACP